MTQPDEYSWPDPRHRYAGFSQWRKSCGCWCAGMHHLTEYSILVWACPRIKNSKRRKEAIENFEEVYGIPQHDFAFKLAVQNSHFLAEREASQRVSRSH